jgi:hypothetical protein
MLGGGGQRYQLTVDAHRYFRGRSDRRVRLTPLLPVSLVLTICLPLAHGRGTLTRLNKPSSRSFG